MEYDNPALRLLLLLRDGKSLPPTESCYSAWHRLLETGGDNDLLLSRLGKVMTLKEQAIEALKEAYPQREPFWRHWEATLNRAFMQQTLGGKWESFIAPVDDHTLNYLQMSADMLDAKRGTKAIGNDEIAGLKASLVGLVEEALNGDLDTDVKRYVVHYLGKLIAALDEYRLTGATPVLESVEAAFGHAITHPAYKDFLSDTSLGSRIVDALAATANIVTVVTGLPQLHNGLKSLLGIATGS